MLMELILSVNLPTLESDDLTVTFFCSIFVMESLISFNFSLISLNPTSEQIGE